MIVAKFPRTAALVLAFLTVVPAFPPTAATHIAGVVDVPILPPVKPSDTCVGVQGAQEVLARANQIVASTEYGFRDDLGVPSICGLDGKPIETWREVVRQLDAVLETYRQTARELQRQLDQRLEATIPQGPCTDGDAIGENAPTICPILRPKVTLLSDRFDGRRTGGFGDWTVVSPGGEEPQFHESATTTLNGTQHTWRFGAPEGYERGAHEWLVSPQIDLGAATPDPVLTQALVLAHTQAYIALEQPCYGGGNIPIVTSTIYSNCGADPEANAALIGLIESYQEALDQFTRGLPLGQAAATMDLTFRHNMAFAADGVRVWLWAGEDAPTRIQLYNLSLGKEKGAQRCVPQYHLVRATTQAQASNQDGFVCVDQGGKEGKAFLLMSPPGNIASDRVSGNETKAFKDASRAPQPGVAWSLTGDQRDFRTVRVDLTDHVGERVWILLEVMTTPDTGRGEDYFGDAGRFPRRQDFGFELARVHVEADGAPRNLRVNDVASAYDRIPRGNPFGDPRDVRTTIPPGEDLRVRVHNAGGYFENATLQVRFEERKHSNGVPIGGFEPIETSQLRVVNLKPNEAREVRVPWPKGLVEGNLYRATATLDADDATLRADDLAEPETTTVRPANLAETDGNATRVLLLRAFTQHDLAAVNVPDGDGPIVEVCSEYTPGDGCKQFYVADKGEKRLLVTGIRNDGSLPEDATVTLDLRLDGVDKNSAVIDGVERRIVGLIPGETRTLQWTLTPTDPGAYNATIVVQLANGETVLTLHRLVFVQRSAGLICFDDLAEARECGPSFSPTRPEVFRGDIIDEIPTALAVAPDGTAWIATAIFSFPFGDKTIERGGLYRQLPGGDWERVQDLTPSALAAAGLSPAREDLSFGDIRAIAFGANGTLYLAGDHATLLQRAADGSLRAHGYPAALSPALRVMTGPGTYFVEQGDNVTLAGSALGGAGGYSYVWAIDSAPTNATGEFHTISPGQEGIDEGGFAGHVNFTPKLPAKLQPTDAPVTYRLGLTAADAAGASAFGRATVVVLPRSPDCVLEDGERRSATFFAVDPIDKALAGSADLVCLQVRLTPESILVDVVPRNLSAADPAQEYTLTFRSRDVDFNVTATWSGGAAGTDLPTTPTPPTPPSANTQNPTKSEVYVPEPPPVPPPAPAALATTTLVTQTLPNGTTISKLRIALNRTAALFPERLDGITVTAASGDRLPDAGALTRVLDREAADLPPPTHLTASGSHRRLDQVDLSWFAHRDALGYEIQASAWKKGPWATVGFVDSSALTTGLPPKWTGVMIDAAVRGLQPNVQYHFRVAELDRVPSDDARDRGAFTAPVAAAPILPRPMHRTAAVFNGTLFVGGMLGQLWRLNEATGVLDHVPLQTLTEDGTMVGYIGDVNALLATSDGARIYAAGDHGTIFTNVGRGGEDWWRTGWSSAATSLRTDARLRDLVQAGGMVYVVGAPGIIARSNRSGTFENVTTPELVGVPLDGTSAFAGPDGRLFIVANDGLRRRDVDGVQEQYIVTCLACDGTDWTYPALPLPSVGDDASVHRARLFAGDAAGGRIVVLAESGILLDYARRGPYPNEADWSVQPALLVNDGGAYQVRVGDQEQVLGFKPAVPDADGAVNTTRARVNATRDHQGWSELRITLSHHLANTTPSAPARVRLHYEEVNYTKLPVGGASTCSTDCGTTTRHFVVWEQLLNVTRTAGWEETVIHAPPPTLDLQVTSPQARAIFSKLELFAPAGNSVGVTTWAVDAVKVEAYFASTREWRPILEWRGPDWPNATVIEPEAGPQAWTLVKEPFNIDAVSPWHISYDLADRPVWVANDEFNSWRAGGTRPHILSGWDSRLVSPIVDLTEASDAVVSFRHDYSFRVMTPGGTTVHAPDGGWIELQYEMRGAECGSEDDSVTCWSRFQTVCPEAPGLASLGVCPAGTGYPSLKQMGYLAGTLYQDADNGRDPYGHQKGPSMTSIPGVDAEDRPAHSYWGRSVDPDPTGVVRDIRATEDYDQVDIVLSKQSLVGDDGERVDLNGRRIRVGFHLFTAMEGDTKWNYTSEAQITNVQTSFPGEGWYITDFKVRGDRVLGMDLAATNATFEVDYDVLARGVGPGTKVPVNVTVENRGRFDVPGYTAEMRVDRIVDASRALVTHVATVPLRQQPLLDKGANRSHIFLWEVPGEAAKVSGATAQPTSILRRDGFTLRAEGDDAREYRLDVLVNGTGTVRVAVVLAQPGESEASACSAAGAPGVTAFQKAYSLFRESTRDSAPIRLALPSDFDLLTREATYVLCAQQEGFAGVYQATLVEEADYAITLEVTPLGIDRDEDPTDNVARLGTPTRPVRARPSPAFDAQVIVTPADATKDITRFLPITLVNVGNVPLGAKGEDVQEYFRVTRRITSGARDSLDTTDCDQWRATVLATGRTGRMVDCRVWNTTVPLGAGARASLASLSSEFSLADDLFWKPPTSADYRVEVTVELLVRPASGAASRADGAGALPVLTVERDAKSFDTYLFDDAELGPRGAGLRGEWEFEPGWGEHAPGFRSTKAYGFGDKVLMRYAPDVDSSLVTPIMDLSTARSARFAFYHRYDFEAGFDGGVIEASADGGQTWHRLTPLANPLNGLPDGYNATLPLAPSSPLDEDGGDPLTRSLAFTGDSNDLPAASDGWVLSIFDLTEFPLIREENVPYEMYDSAALLNYNGAGSMDELFRSTEGAAHIYPTAAANAYFETSWRVGPVDDFRYWEVQNLTQDTVRPIVGGDFWWSGSMSMVDDQLRPVNNSWLVINVSDVASRAAPDDRVVVEWWEWMDRTEQFAMYLQTKYGSTTDHSPDDFRGVFSWTDGGASQPLTHRFNVTKPSILETHGQWVHLQADITDWLQPSTGGPAIQDIIFTYAPVRTDIPLEHAAGAETAYANVTTNYNDRWRDDRGIVIDGFFVNASKVVGGQVVAKRSLLTEDEAWQRHARIEVCSERQSAIPAYNDLSITMLPCYEKAAYGTRYNRSVMEPKGLNAPPTVFGEDLAWAGPAGVPGRTWALAEDVPGVPAGWRVVNVRDKDLRWDNPGDRLPTGEAPVAWYTGSFCQQDVLDDRSHCLLPGEESRLVTPALDLSTVAGSTASLIFDHRYAFWIDASKGHIPLASGGAVEIQVFDEETKTWSPWKQLYPDPEGMYTDVKADGPVANVDPLHKHQATTGYRAGYSAYTGNTSLDGSSREVHRDAPFESHPHYDVAKRNLSYIQFLYSGKSSDVSGSGENAWVNASFDLKDYIGQRVRVGFHVSVAATPRGTQNRTPDFAITQAQMPEAIDKRVSQTGWWITNVAVVGKVLNGAPIQLRARAVTDGNVGDGYWQIDDAGVFGSQYGDNVGIFVEPKQHGGVVGESVTVNVSLRNLGTSVRPNLALEVREVGGHALGLNASLLPVADGPQAELLDNNQILRVSGLTLAPGQTVVIPLNLTVADEISSERLDTYLYMEAKEYNPLDKKFVKIATNEVQGFLRRMVPFTAERHPAVNLSAPRILQAGPLAGEPVSVSVEAANLGFARVKLNVTCSAALILGHDPVDHKKEVLEKPRMGEAYPCELVEGPATLEPLANATLTYRVRPTAVGDVRVTLGGTFELGDRVLEIEAPATLTLPVGRSPVIWHEGFDDPRSVITSFTGQGSFGGGTNGAWEYLRGHEKPGSLLLGTNETELQGTGFTYRCATGPCVAVTPPIDLHNYTNENVILSFWHQKRLALHDGAQVSVQFLIDETKPNSAASWSPLDVLCIAEPRGGYDRSPSVLSRVPGGDNQPQGQDILYPKWTGVGESYESPYVDDKGVEKYPAEFFTNGRLEEGWSRVSFDLGKQFQSTDGTCDPDGPQASRPAENMSIVGHTVRFVFTVYGAPFYPPGGFSRGMGHGWLIDDITVSTAGIRLGPAVAQQATLLDNTTKAFNVVLTNDADYPDRVLLSFDAASSSAPAGSVIVPKEPVLLQAHERKLVTVHVTLPRDPSLLPTQFKARILATSLRDPNAYASTDLQLDFAPRQWAELAVAAQAPRTTVQEGTETFVPITIENAGVVTSVPTRVRITDRALGDTRPPGPCPEGGGTVDGVTCIDLPPMPSYFQDADQASRVLEFRWRPEKGTVGLHTLTIEVDPDQLGEEYTRTNNVVALSVAVSELLLPDVDVARADALKVRNAVGQVLEPLKEGGVTRFESTTGELVTLEVKVRNVGKAAATNVDVRAFVGPLSLPARTVPFIAPDNEVVLTFNWVAQKGDYPVEVVARSEQVELSTANNRNPAIGVTLLVVKGYEVKVAMDPIEGVLEPGTEVKVPFNVTNAGNAGEEVRIVARAPEGWAATVPRSALFLRAGETYGAVATVVVPAHAVAGEQFISVDAIARGNPMKAATASAKGVVRAYYDGAVATTAARAAPPTIVLPIDLENKGNSLEPWTLAVDLPAGWAAAETLPAKVVVPAHGALTYALRVALPQGVTPGNRTLAVHATLPDGTRRDGAVEVRIDPLRAAVAKVVDERPRETQGALSYPVVVENVGNVEQPFEVMLLEQPSGLSATLAPARFTLAPGGKAVATLTVKPTPDAKGGAVQLASYAAFAGVVPDTPEGRSNQQRLQVSVVRPDLRMAQLDYAKAGVETGERVVVKVPVTNDGQAPTTDLPVHLFVDDVFIGEARVDALAPGETRDVTLAWTALPGKHTVTAVVDPYRDTVDADRADNTVSGLVEVQSAPIRGLVGGQRVPFATPFLLLVALAAALAVLTPLHGARRPPR